MPILHNLRGLHELVWSKWLIRQWWCLMSWLLFAIFGFRRGRSFQEHILGCWFKIHEERHYGWCLLRSQEFEKEGVSWCFSQFRILLKIQNQSDSIRLPYRSCLPPTTKMIFLSNGYISIEFSLRGGQMKDSQTLPASLKKIGRQIFQLWSHGWLMLWRKFTDGNFGNTDELVR